MLKVNGMAVCVCACHLPDVIGIKSKGCVLHPDRTRFGFSRSPEKEVRRPHLRAPLVTVTQMTYKRRHAVSVGSRFRSRSVRARPRSPNDVAECRLVTQRFVIDCMTGSREANLKGYNFDRFTA